MQIQISWLLKKPTDLELHCLQRQDISGFSRTRVKHLSVSHSCSREGTDKITWIHRLKNYFHLVQPASVAQLDVHQTGGQEVVDSIPTGSVNPLMWILIMKYSPQSFSPLC